MSKKNTAINYTSRDFESIRRDLEDFAKRYYPNTYKDFNRASFGSLMLDTVSYVGDILSFYLDYQMNETFLDSAVEYDNVVKLARQLGYKLQTSPSSYGRLTFFVEVPASPLGLGPEATLIPVLQAGSTFSSTGGGFYTLLGDVDFSLEGNQIVVGSADSATGIPLTYVIRATGIAVSGRLGNQQISIGDFVRFRRVPLEISNVSNIVKVTDSEGNEYFEVDHLSQNIIYKAIRNTTTTRETVPNLLKATPVARRFTVETLNGLTFLQFGYGSDSNSLTNPVVDPTEVVLDLNGRTYTTDSDFDPTKLIDTDKFGIGPSNTTLTVQYRFNTTSDVNAAVDTINGVANANFKFNNQGSLSPANRNSVINSLEVTNEEQFVGSVSLPSSEEIRQRAFSYFATQNSAVTAQDYQAICYVMPAKFGMIKRAAILKDPDEFKRNVNIYVISENSSGKLTAANTTLKNNLKNWITQYKMISDTVDILDAEIVNFDISYEILTDINANRFDVINSCNERLTSKFIMKQDIGEPIKITDIYRELQKVNGVVDVTSVDVGLKSGGIYSESNYDFDAALSSDGRMIEAQPNIVFELKYPNVDIKGSIR
jgi:phage-related baseplate assembly protein